MAAQRNPPPLRQRSPLPPTSEDNGGYVDMRPRYVSHDQLHNAHLQQQPPAMATAGPSQYVPNPQYGAVGTPHMEVEGSLPPPLPPKPIPPQPRPPMPTPRNAAEQQTVPQTAGTGAYIIMQDPKDMQIFRLNNQLKDMESSLKQRERELETSHMELQKTRQCVQEKKEEVKAQKGQLEQLRSQVTQLQQSLSNTPPRVASNEAAFQVEVQQLRRTVDNLRRENEHLQRQRSVPPTPPVSSQEMLRLREQLQWVEAEKFRLLREVEGLRSNEAVLTMQVRTYKEDFESERRDRERANEQLVALKEENETLNQIVNVLAPNGGIQHDREPPQLALNLQQQPPNH